MEKQKTVCIILVALFAALMAAGAFIRIPLPPVPITLQTLFALLCGMLLPVQYSLASVGVYLFLGLAGLPIFTSGGGIAAITGPTGGYLVGLVPAVLAAGLVMKFWKGDSVAKYILAAVLGTVMVYIPGLLWLSHSRSLGLAATLASGLYPFIVGDLLKLIVSIYVSKRLRGRVDKLMTSRADED